MNTLEVPDWYEIINEFKNIDNSYLSNQYDEFWNEHDDDELDELTERFNNQYIEERKESQYTKKALTTIIGAFLARQDRRGLVHEKTGWEFWELRPFENKEGFEGDILLAKPDEGKTIMVMLLPERNTPKSVVEDAKESIKIIRNNLSSFSFRASADGVNSAIVVDPPRDEDTSAAIKSEGGDMSKNLFVWRVYDVEDSDEEEDKKILDHFADLDHNLQPIGLKIDLLDMLEGGVEIQNGREFLPDFFITSHHSVFLDHIIGHVVQCREERDDGPLTHFARKEIEEYIERTLFEVGMSEEASDKTELLLTRWDQMGLIRPVSTSRNDIKGSDFYRFTVSGNQSQENILKEITRNYQSDSVQFEMEIEAMKWALEAYRDEYGEQTTLMEKFSS